MDLVDKIMTYEAGGLDDAEVVELYQELHDTGILWELQGHYGRRASLMLQEGMIGQ
jgi:hypothetical protein